VTSITPSLHSEIWEGYVQAAADISDLKLPDLMTGLEKLGQNHPQEFLVSGIRALCEQMMDSRKDAGVDSNGKSYRASSMDWVVTEQGRVVRSSST
jgi:hypothetical protein